jgi:hypothetical protein
MLATSINVHIRTLSALSRAAQAMGVSRRDVVVRLLMRIMHDVDMYQSGCRTVRYQPDDEKGKWRCFPLKFKPDENEFFADLRKVCKCSVSLLVAMAVDRYLDELLTKSAGKIEYNYNIFRNYFIKKVIIDGIICWQIYWGTPKNHSRPRLE